MLSKMNFSITQNKSFPFYRQMDSVDCGPACLQMIAKYFGKYYPLPYLREECFISRNGVSLRGLAVGADTIGLRSMAVKVAYQKKNKNDHPGLTEAPLPCIAHWNQNHFVVVFKITKKYVWISDPAKGKIKLKPKEFMSSWSSHGDEGLLLLLKPGTDFYDNKNELRSSQLGFSFLKSYLTPYTKLIVQLVLGLALGSVFSMVFPFLTQSIVDIGIQNQNLSFINLVLVGQLMLFISQMIVHFIQSWILLHVGVKLNVDLLTDFLSKLMKLPIGFFDSKMTGDLLQRVGDHTRIERFLTHSLLQMIFSVFNLFVFGIVLALYSIKIFAIFFIATLLYFSWIYFFLDKRKNVDYQAFEQMASNQDALIEMIQGMSEIKLQGSKYKRLWKWAEIQAKLFRVRSHALSISQYQDAGALFINQLKDILIIFFAAKLVLEGTISLGMMLAIQYIIGQINVPLQQLVGFVRSTQDAKISIDRLGEIHLQPNESNTANSDVRQIPTGNITISNLSFRYSPISEWVLSDFSLTIPRGKITAIVGVSGSGKTTLLKLLLAFYQQESGSIKVGSQNLHDLDKEIWRKNTGVVMQDGFFFSDTIANNISESSTTADYARIYRALDIASIQSFIDTLPLGVNTMIGAKGNSLSQGQKQRLLIARAVYKEPHFMLFDEATNALDANNEKQIMENLANFFIGRTVVIVAHRLSTVRDADKIVVIDSGKVAEEGRHETLIAKKGLYYKLIKNQLELGL